LFSLLQADKVQDIFEEIGGRNECLRNDLLVYFKNDFLQYKEKDARTVVQPSVGVHRIIDKVAELAKLIDTSSLYPVLLMLAIFEEKESYARYYMEVQGIKRHLLIRFVDEHSSCGNIGNRDIQLPALVQKPKSLINVEETKVKTHIDSIYLKNLSKLYCSGKYDKYFFRISEIAKVEKVFVCRDSHNCLVVGDKGVGKTAFVYSLVAKFAEHKNQFFKGMQFLELNCSYILMQLMARKDTSELFAYLKKEISAQGPTLIFVDHIEKFVDANGSNSILVDFFLGLEQFFTVNNVYFIVCTNEKFLKLLNNDSSWLSERFQKLSIKAPSNSECLQILQTCKKKYENFHKLKYTDKALRQAVSLCSKYVRDLCLPASAIDLIDQAAASFKINRGEQNKSSACGLSKDKLNSSWIKKTLSINADLPLEELSVGQKQKLSGLSSELKEHIFGQDEAIDTVVKKIRFSKLQLVESTKPLGTFLFYGPSGVGKTELSKQVAKFLAYSFVCFDMSEYMEKHSVSRMIGSPPGYIGYGEGGLLTEKVKKNPRCVLLFDEIEKAHQDIHNIMLQIMDRGVLTDSSGVSVDFKQVVIFMTSNVGSRALTTREIGLQKVFNVQGSQYSLLSRHFSPEFLNRFDSLVGFNCLHEKSLEKIIFKDLSLFCRQLQAKGYLLEIDKAVNSKILLESKKLHFGARAVLRYIDSYIKSPISERIICGKLNKKERVCLQLDKSQIKLLPIT
jgi:ATP-dependent Clp protease ATP-binding subunit ClpA